MWNSFKPGYHKIFFTLLILPFCYIALTLLPSVLLKACFQPSLDQNLTQFCNGIASFLHNTEFWLLPALAVVISYTICAVFTHMMPIKNMHRSVKQKLLIAFPIVIFIIGVIITWPLSYLLYLGPLFILGGTTNSITNQSKPLVAAVLPYAQSQGWQSVADLNISKGIDNQIPQYVKVFLANQSPNEIKEGLFNFLTEQGYTMQATWYIPAPEGGSTEIGDHPDNFWVNDSNFGQPYWVLSGVSTTGNSILVEITDRGYDDNAENITVPSGLTAVSMRFA